MGTSSVSPANGSADFPKNANQRVQMQFVDGNFNKVTVVKPFNTSAADNIKSVDDAIAALGQDEVLAALKAGILNKERQAVRESTDGWHILTEDNTDGGVYSGERLDGDKVNALVLGIAKSAFSTVYVTDAGKAKDMARDFIKSQPALLPGLKVEIAASEAE